MDEIQSLVQELTCGDDNRAETAAHNLGALGPQVMAVLQDLLNAEQSETRWWAVRAMAEVHDPAIPLLLIRALHDPEYAVRECAALGLRKQPDRAAIPDLIECLQGENSQLARLAVDALASIGEEAVPPLLELLKDGPQKARLAAVRALALIGDTRSIPALFEALGADSAVMEYWANEGLEKMGVGMSFFKP
jgi:HEAT repeat protein